MLQSNPTGTLKFMSKEVLAPRHLTDDEKKKCVQEVI